MIHTENMLSSFILHASFAVSVAMLNFSMGMLRRDRAQKQDPISNMIHMILLKTHNPLCAGTVSGTLMQTSYMYPEQILISKWIMHFPAKVRY